MTDTPFDDLGPAFAEALGRDHLFIIDGAPVTLRAIVRRRRSVDVLPEGETPMAADLLTCTLPDSAPPMREGSAVVIDDASYVVRAVARDGRAMRRLILERD